MRVAVMTLSSADAPPPRVIRRCQQLQNRVSSSSLLSELLCWFALVLPCDLALSPKSVPLLRLVPGLSRYRRLFAWDMLYLRLEPYRHTLSIR